MWSLAWEPPLWKRKYMYTNHANSESIPFYFKYLEYSYLNVTFWPIMGKDIRDLKKLNWYYIVSVSTLQKVSMILHSFCFYTSESVHYITKFMFLHFRKCPWYIKISFCLYTSQSTHSVMVHSIYRPSWESYTMW